MAAVFPAGLWYCVKNVNDERVFSSSFFPLIFLFLPIFSIYRIILVILYAVTAVYFAGVMVRLMLTLAPVVCVLAGIAFSYTYEVSGICELSERVCRLTD